jgi:hypothetical protein
MSQQMGSHAWEFTEVQLAAQKEWGHPSKDKAAGKEKAKKWKERVLPFASRKRESRDLNIGSALSQLVLTVKQETADSHEQHYRKHRNFRCPLTEISLKPMEFFLIGYEWKLRKLVNFRRSGGVDEI